MTLSGERGSLVRITRDATDRLCLRASIGGSAQLGYYLVWRGDNPDEIIDMLRTTLKAAEEVLPHYRRPQG